jgi:hypothetical protein
MKMLGTLQSWSDQYQAPLLVAGSLTPPAQNWPSGWPAAQFL